MSEATESEPSRRLGDFEIVREIGRGGMGVVYEARQVSLNRKVALKVLSGSLGLTSKAVARFRREAEAAGKLHHTNIVPIYATGEEGGTHYYAMELVEGPSLDVVIRELRRAREKRDQAALRPDSRQAPRRSDQEERPRASGPADGDMQTSTATGTTTLPSWLLETLTEDSAPAHTPATGRGSPTMLTTGSRYFDTIARMVADVAGALDYAHSQGVIHRDVKPSNLLLSPEGKLSINDFGLARMLEQPGMTMTGEFVGSPLYMSPEQITAGRIPLDQRTDLYSLGAALYELLTLRPPFRGERRDQIIAQIVHKEPASPRRVNRKVPVDLETICLKALEKDPDRRYQTAGQMAEDLRRFVNRFAISAKRTGPLARAVKWARRRPALAATLLLALVAVGAAGLFAYSAHVSRQRVAEVKRQKAKDDALLAAMSGDFEAAAEAIEQAELLGASAGWIRMLQGQLALHQSQPLVAVQHLQQAVRLLPENVAARSLLAHAWAEAGNWERYYELLAEVDRLVPVTAEDFLFKGRAEAWEASAAHGLEMLDEAVRRRDTAVARVIRARSRIWRALDTGSLDDIEAALEDAAVAKSMLPDNPLALSVHLTAHLVAADLFGEAGQPARRGSSLAEAERDARALERFSGLDKVHYARGTYFEHIGRGEAALAELRRGIEAPDASGLTVRTYAAVLYRRGDFEEALRVLEEFGPESDDSITTTYRLYILTELPDGQARALAGYREIAGRDVRGLMALYPQTLLRLLGHRSEAVEACRQMRERFRQMPAWMLEWYRHLLDYSCDRLSAEQLLKAAGWRRGNQCEAHFFIGLDLLAEGDRAGAARQFQKSLDTHVSDYFEYYWSRAFLERIQQDPTWPPWIPVKDAVTSKPASPRPDPSTEDD